MRDYKKPDLNKPRYRTEVIAFKNREFYATFRKKYPEHKNVSDKILRSIIETHDKNISNTVIENRDGVELQSGLGYLFVGSINIPSKRKNTVNVDHKKSALCGKEVAHRNLHTDGRMGKIFYSNYLSKYRLRDRDLWVFSGHRDFTRKVAETFPSNYKKYIEVENYLRISKIFKRNQRKSIAIKLNADIDISNYNEFDLD